MDRITATDEEIDLHFEHLEDYLNGRVVDKEEAKRNLYIEFCKLQGITD